MVSLVEVIPIYYYRYWENWVCDDSFRIDKTGKPAPQGCDLQFVVRGVVCRLCKREGGE